MSKLTPFGLEVRTQRLRKNIRLNEMAEKIGVSSSFASGIEVGRRPIPNNYVEKVIKALAATQQEQQQLIYAADQTRDTINIQRIQSYNGKALVSALARKVDHLTPEQQEAIRKIITSHLSSIENEQPFKRKRGHIVSPKSYASIWHTTEEFYNCLPKQNNGWLDIQLALERVHTDYKGWEFDVVETKSLPYEEGRTDFTNQTIILREDIWNKLVKNDCRARFTACHEYGHFVLHSNQNIIMRRSNENNYPIYQDAEWQADVFAASLLMPASQAQKAFNESSSDITLPELFGISLAAYETISLQYMKHGKLKQKL